MTAIRCALPRAVVLFFAGAIVGGVAHLLYMQRQDTTAHDETQFLKHALARASRAVERGEHARTDNLSATDLQNVFLIPLLSPQLSSPVAAHASISITSTHIRDADTESAGAAPAMPPSPPLGAAAEWPRSDCADEAGLANVRSESDGDTGSSSALAGADDADPVARRPLQPPPGPATSEWTRARGSGVATDGSRAMADRAYMQPVRGSDSRRVVL